METISDNDAQPGRDSLVIPKTKVNEATLNEINAKKIDTSEIHRNGAPDVASIDLKPSVANCKNP